MDSDKIAEELVNWANDLVASDRVITITKEEHNNALPLTASEKDSYREINKRWGSEGMTFYPETKEHEEFIENMRVSAKVEYKAIFTGDSKKVNLERTGKFILGEVDDEDNIKELTWKEFKSSTAKFKSTDKVKNDFIQALLKQEKQFNRKVEFNSFSKKGNPSFEDKVDWLLKNTKANYTKKGIKAKVAGVNSTHEAVGNTKELTKEWKKADEALGDFFRWARDKDVSRKTLKFITESRNSLASAFQQTRDDLDLTMKASEDSVRVALNKNNLVMISDLSSWEAYFVDNIRDADGSTDKSAMKEALDADDTVTMGKVIVTPFRHLSSSDKRKFKEHGLKSKFDI